MAFIDELRAYEGKVIGPAQPAQDAVNQAMIRHWCDAMGDTNPVYTDPATAQASSHGQVIAPPAMIQAWTMRGFARHAQRFGTLQDELLGKLDAAGFSSVVATASEQVYHRDVVLGDHISLTTTIESVSDEKHTALGVGHFVTTRMSFTDAAGDAVGEMLWTLLKFKPGTGRGSKAGEAAEQPQQPQQRDASESVAAPTRARRPRPAITRDNAFFFEGAKQGKLLVQRCSGCGALRHPPRPACPQCRSFDWEPLQCSGRGVVYSYVVNHYPQVPAFDYPLPVALVELEEGPRFVSDLAGVDAADVHIGMAVQAEFVAHDEDLTLPQFRPVAKA